MVEKIAKKFFSFDFEVFGKVQGVFFRKYTGLEANKLHLVGWCKNTFEGTVVGNVQGKKMDCLAMKKWLKEKGSPHSRIERLETKNEKEIDVLDYKKFTIERD